MNVRKLALSGISVVAGAAMFLPAGSVGAASPTGLKPLLNESNAALDVQTELNCNNHSIEAVVKNKSAGKVTPQFTLDNYKIDSLNQSVEPGKTTRFMLPFAGNDYNAQLEVAVDAQPPMKLSPGVHCVEPVSFKVTQTSASAISGYLTNNSGFVGQTVSPTVNGKTKQLEWLQPNETRYVVFPVEQQPGIAGSEINNALLTLATANGYQGSYLVDLNRLPTVPPLPPVPVPTENRK